MYKFLAYQECIRDYSWSFGHSDPDLSSVVSNSSWDHSIKERYTLQRTYIIFPNFLKFIPQFITPFMNTPVPTCWPSTLQAWQAWQTGRQADVLALQGVFVCNNPGCKAACGRCRRRQLCGRRGVEAVGAALRHSTLRGSTFMALNVLLAWQGDEVRSFVILHL